MSIDTIKSEHTNLELHVELCAQRYSELDTRLCSLEVKTDAILSEIRQNKTEIVKIVVGTAGSVIIAMLGLITTILMKF
jgi:hypothetical protein